VQQLLIATANEGKFLEIKEGLSGLPFGFLSLRDMPAFDSVPCESAETFAENAAGKANFYFGKTGIPTVADDSGIIVEALRGELGVHTRRWGAGPAATDEEWISFFLERMKKERNKRATFVCVLALTTERGLQTFEGMCEGIITDVLEAPYLPGLPLSACFRPDGHTCVFSALSIEQKNCSSHRGRAMRKLRDYLGRLTGLV
jgi:XTP/dITP diphosphohydrolase